MIRNTQHRWERGRRRRLRECKRHFACSGHDAMKRSVKVTKETHGAVLSLVKRNPTDPQVRFSGLPLGAEFIRSRGSSCRNPLEQRAKRADARVPHQGQLRGDRGGGGSGRPEIKAWSPREELSVTRCPRRSPSVGGSALKADAVFKKPAARVADPDVAGFGRRSPEFERAAGYCRD